MRDAVTSTAKIAGVNTAAILASMTNLETVLRIGILAASFFYTVAQLFFLIRDKAQKPKEKNE